MGLATAMLDHLAEKLVGSRWQRDRSDSTALRSVGTAFGYSLVALSSARRGVSKLDVNEAAIADDLDQSWEVLAEAVQTVMRRAGAAEPYEALKAATRGRQLDRDVYAELLNQLDLAPADRAALGELTPAAYVGNAEHLALAALAAAANVDVQEVGWTDAEADLRRVREAVFIAEQGIEANLEFDGADNDANHFAARLDGAVVGTGRLLESGQIGRMAVLPQYRGAGVGRAILDAAVTKARRDGRSVFLFAQADVVPFYEAAGFVARGDRFEEAGIEHQEMYLP